MATIKQALTSVHVIESKGVRSEFYGKSAGSISATTTSTGDYAEYIALNHAYNATLAQLEERAYQIMRDVETEEQFKAMRDAFNDAYKADYAKRFKQGELSDKEWTKKIDNAKGVAWKRLWERAEAHMPQDGERWMSPIEKKTRAKPATTDATPTDANAVDAANLQNAVSRKGKPESLSALCQAFVTDAASIDEAAELAAVVDWARTSGANLKALIAWHAAQIAEQQKPTLKAVPTARKRTQRKAA